MAVTASAPGKLVLLGDHAVVYGRPCLVTAVDIRYSVTVIPTAQDDVCIETSSDVTRRFKFDASMNDYPEKNTAFIEAALRQVARRYGPLPHRGLHITTSGPTMSYGLGSSSAVTAAAVAALLALLNLPAEDKLRFDLALAAVLDVQGKGSGADLAAAVYGGTVHYVRGENDAVVTPVRAGALPLVIGYSGQKVDTVSLIERVRYLYDRQPEVMNALFDLMGLVTEFARDAILENQWGDLGDLVNIHQGLLESLTVCTPQLSRLIYAARDSGALGAKLSGAGGGDCMFAVATPEARTAVEDAIGQNGTLVDLPTGAPGVRIDYFDPTGR